MSEAVDYRNKMVQRLDNMRTMKAEVGLQWLDAKVKYAKAKAEIEKNLVEGTVSGALHWLKEHGPWMAFFMVLTSILTSSTSIFLKVIGYFIKSFRLGALAGSIYTAYENLMADAFGPAINNLHVIRVTLDEYKNEIDKYYGDHEQIIKFMWPEVAEAKEKFDKEYARLMLIEQAIKTYHDLGPIDALKLIQQIYETLENLERLGNDWIEKLNRFMDKAISLMEGVLWVLSAKLNVMRSQIEDMMRKREQDYQDCLSRGQLPDGTWHRPMPEFMLDSGGNIIGLFQGS